MKSISRFAVPRPAPAQALSVATHAGLPGLDELGTLLRVREPDVVLLVGSFVEGWSTLGSDLDVIVLTDDPPDRKPDGFATYLPGGSQKMDVSYESVHRLDHVGSTVRQEAAACASSVDQLATRAGLAEDLHLLYRTGSGLALLGQERHQELVRTIPWADAAYLGYRRVAASSSGFRDVVGAVYQGDLMEAALLLRGYVQAQALAMVSLAGDYEPVVRRLSRRLRRLGPVGEEPGRRLDEVLGAPIRDDDERWVALEVACDLVDVLFDQAATALDTVEALPSAAARRDLLEAAMRESGRTHPRTLFSYVVKGRAVTPGAFPVRRLLDPDADLRALAAAVFGVAPERSGAVPAEVGS